MQRGAGALAGSGDTSPDALPGQGRASGPEDRGQSPERVLVTVAVRDYDDGDTEFTEGIDEQLAVLDEWWCSPDSAEPFHKVPQPELRERHDVERFLYEAGVRENRGKALVLFITGHGRMGSSRTHFLQLPGTDPKRQLATAVRTSDLVAAALDSHAENVLVIVNTCFAQGVAGELLPLFGEIAGRRRRGAQLDVVATCDQDQLVQVRRFPSVLRRVLDRLRTSAQITHERLSVTQLMTEFENELGSDPERRKHRLHRVIDGSGSTVPSPCLPNPGYRPPREVVAPARRPVATPAADIDVWLARASGRPHADDPGWYFSGRRRLNTALAAFLGRPGGVLLLTGTAGSGKSAVLGRAVTLSDPLFRANPRYQDAVGSAPPETVPAEEAVSVAVLARRRTAADVLGELLRGLGVDPPAPGPADDPVERWTALLDAYLGEPGDPVTVVLDGLDEAAEPFRIVHGVLAPLGAHCVPPPGALPPGAALPGPRRSDPGTCRRRLRLVIGVRSSRPATGPGEPGEAGEADSAVPGAVAEAAPAAGRRETGLLGALREVFPSATVLRTDGRGSRADIADYVEALIGTGTSPGTEDGEALGPAAGTAGTARRAAAVREAAETVAAEVWPSFLDARLAGEQLRAAPDPAALVASPRWRELLHTGTTGLLRRDLHLARTEGLPPDVALALLRAGAFALGAGIPWSTVWPAVAGALLGRPVEEPDRMIGILLRGRLSGYLAHDHEDDRIVYRPAHERLAEILRDQRQNLLPDRGDPPAPADAGDVKDAADVRDVPDVRDVRDVKSPSGPPVPPGLRERTGPRAAAEPGRAALPDQTARRRSGRTAPGRPTPVVPGVPGASGTPGTWTTRAEAHRLIAEALAGLVAEDATVPPHPYLSRHLAAHAARGDVLDDAHVPRALLPWETSGKVRTLLRQTGTGQRQEWLEAWAAIEPFLGDADPESRQAGLHLAHHAATHRRVPLSELPAPERHLTGSCLTPLWTDWTATDNVLAVTDTVVESLAHTVTSDGRPLLVTGDSHGTLRRWETYGAPVGAPARTRGGALQHLLPLPDDLLVSGGTDGTVRVWDSTRGRLLGEALRRPHTWVSGLTLLTPAAGPSRVLVAHSDGRLTALDPVTFHTVATSDPSGPSDPSDPSDLDDTAGSTSPSTPAASAHADTDTDADAEAEADAEADTEVDVDADADADETAAEPAADLPALDPAPAILAGVRLGPGEGMALAVAQGGRVGVWRPGKGLVPLGEHPDEVRAVVGLPAPNRFATCDDSGHLGFWDAAEGGGEVTAGPPPARSATALAAVPVDGESAVVCAGSDHVLRVWDTGTRRPLGGPLEGHTATPLALAAVPGAVPSVVSAGGDRTLRRWLLTGHGSRPAPAVRRSVVAAALPGRDVTGGPLLVAVADEEEATLWNADTGGHVRLPVGDSAVTAFAWTATADGPLLVTAHSDASVQLWSVGAGAGSDLAGAPVRRGTLVSHSLPVQTMAAFPDGTGRTLLATGGADGSVHLWDLGRQTRLACWDDHRLSVRDLAVLTTGHGPRVVSAGADGTLRSWDPATGPAGPPVHCGQQGVHAVAAVPAGPGERPLLASGGEDGTVRLWDAETLCPAGAALDAADGPVTALACFPAPAGRPHLAATGPGGTVHIWDVTTGARVRRVVTGSPLGVLRARPADGDGTPPGHPVLLAAGKAGLSVFELDLGPY
ncbi:hypothetical protein [Streptomyces sp. NPDC004042]|uniref:hypothetical protein n=1 Tax=Streptomyces sp. NPDC004042 TaxID=3154451 RepID=UPI0033A541D8